MTASVETQALDDLRVQIDYIDVAIATLLKERASVSAQIQSARVGSGGARVDLGREREVIATYVSELGKDGAGVATTVLTFCRGELANAHGGKREG